MTTYLATDLEFAWDEYLHEAHRSIDPTSNRHAVATKRVTAAATFAFSIDNEGRLSSGALRSWTEYQWGDEQAVVTQLFDHLRANPAPMLTYGGIAVDVPVLVLAGMEHGLPLPPQLLDVPGRKGPRLHIDLGLQLKGGGRTWSHLSQVLLRLGVPLAIVRGKPGVSCPQSAEAWQALRDHVELDCLLLAIAKVGWLVAQGKPGLRLEPAAIALVSGFLRQRPEHGATAMLRDYARALEGRYGGKLALAA